MITTAAASITTTNNPVVPAPTPIAPPESMCGLPGSGADGIGDMLGMPGSTRGG